MPPQPKRKWHRPRGDRSNGTATPSQTATASPLTQQPKRPKVNEMLEPVEKVDVRQMYTTAAGDAVPKPFSDLKGVLDEGLLKGLDKLGFE